MASVLHIDRMGIDSPRRESLVIRWGEVSDNVSRGAGHRALGWACMPGAVELWEGAGSEFLEASGELGAGITLLWRVIASTMSSQQWRARIFPIKSVTRTLLYRTPGGAPSFVVSSFVSGLIHAGPALAAIAMARSGFVFAGLLSSNRIGRFRLTGITLTPWWIHPDPWW